MKNRVLILGSEGYIGTALFEFLSSLASISNIVEFDFSNKIYSVSGLDICWFGKNRSNTIQSDYRHLTEEDLEKYDVIILLAGHSSVKMCDGSFSDVLSNNVYNFTDLMRKIQNCKNHIKFIYASSSSVYGSVGSVPAKEDSINFSAHNSYDLIKYMIDLVAPRYDVEYYGLRFGTVNGYSEKMRNDVMINAMVSSAKTTEKINLFSGHTARAVLGISDLCFAINSIIADESDNRGHYNLCSFNSTAKEIAYVVGDIIGVPVEDVNNVNNMSSYDFHIDTSKFETTFNFSFKDTIESISMGILQNYEKIQMSSREEFKPYDV